MLGGNYKCLLYWEPYICLMTVFVLLQDFNLTNTRIVSSGTDNSIKIWAIDTPQMKTAIEVRRLWCTWMCKLSIRACSVLPL
jgi:hypothetical protein